MAKVSVYVALGIDLQGQKDILGLWISENESDMAIVFRTVNNSPYV